MTQPFLYKSHDSQVEIKKVCKRSAISALALLFLVSPLGLKLSHAESLQEALSLAYMGSPVLDAARAQLRSIDEGRASAISAWRPTIRVSANSGLKVTNSETNGIGTYSKTYPTGATLTIEESLYEGGKKFAALEKAENQIKAQRATLIETEQDLLLSAAQAYVDVVRDSAILELSISNEAVLRSQLAATEDRFQVGEETRTDVAQSRSRLAQTISNRVDAEGDLSTSQATYKRIIGQLPTALTSVVELPELPETLEMAQTEALQNNPLVVRRGFAEKVAENAIEEAEANLLPRVSLKGEASTSFGFGETDQKTQDLSLTGQLVIPIYQTGAEYSNIRSAKQVRQQRRGEWEEARRLVVERGTRSWEQLMSTRARIQALQTSIQASEIALEGVKQENQVGSRTTLDVLDAEQELLDAKVSLVTAQRDELVASFQLLQATGRLTAQKLGLNVELYDPTQHYDDVRGKWIGVGDSDSE